MKKFLALALFALSLPLMAQDTSRADLTQLTKEQQLEVLTNVAEKAKANAANMANQTPQMPSTEKVSRMVDVGKQVAELLPIFAEKLGTSADMVLKSFAGKVLLLIVLVHFFWTKIAGISILVFGLTFWWKWFRKMFLLKEQTCVIHPNNILAWFGCTKTVTTYPIS